MANTSTALRVVRDVPEKAPSSVGMWWPDVPVEYRDCYAENRHDLDIIAAGLRSGYELEWNRCVRCTTERLTTIDPQGHKTHDYFYPADYKEKRPVLTEQDRADYFLWRAKTRRKENKDLPKFDLRALAEKFPRVYARI